MGAKFPNIFKEAAVVWNNLGNNQQAIPSAVPSGRDEL